MLTLNTPSHDRRRLPVNRDAGLSTLDDRLPGATPARLETHWTRALHHDLFAPWRTPDPRDDAAKHRAAPARSEPREETRREAFGPRTPMVAGVLLLGFYVALYLAVSAVIRIFTLDEAVMAQPAGGGADRPESTSAMPRAAMPPSPPIA